MTARTPGAGARESAVDLSILGATCAFGFAIARTVVNDLPDGLESTGTAFMMAVGGALARFMRKKARSR